MVIALFTIILALLITCGFIMLFVYMYNCFKNGIDMFKNLKYEERIEKLEKEIKELRRNK